MSIFGRYDKDNAPNTKARSGVFVLGGTFCFEGKGLVEFVNLGT